VPPRPADLLATGLRRVAGLALRAATRVAPDPAPPAPPAASGGPPEHWRSVVAARAPGLLRGEGIGATGVPPARPRSPHAPLPGATADARIAPRPADTAPVPAPAPAPVTAPHHRRSGDLPVQPGPPGARPAGSTGPAGSTQLGAPHPSERTRASGSTSASGPAATVPAVRVHSRAVRPAAGDPSDTPPARPVPGPPAAVDPARDERFAPPAVRVGEVRRPAVTVVSRGARLAAPTAPEPATRAGSPVPQAKDAVPPEGHGGPAQSARPVGPRLPDPHPFSPRVPDAHLSDTVEPSAGRRRPALLEPPPMRLPSPPVRTPEPAHLPAPVPVPHRDPGAAPWPALPDDGPLWTIAATGYPAELLHRLDREQVGR